MMMGSLEEDITIASTAPEMKDEVINDLDLTEEEIALENREEYLTKVPFSFWFLAHFWFFKKKFEFRLPKGSKPMKWKC